MSMTRSEADWLLADTLKLIGRDAMANPGDADRQARAAEMCQAPVVRYDNVESYWAESLKDYWDVDADFPCIRPPFDRMWLISGGYRSFAVSGERKDGLKNVTLAIFAMVGSKNQQSLVSLHVYARVAGRATFLMSVHFRCDEHGVPAGNAKVPIFSSPAVPAEWATDLAPHFYQPALLAICFMHCKNVRFTASVPSRAVVRSCGPLVPLERWHELEIGDIKQRLDAGRTETGGSLQRAMHICRGSFANYTESKPLFGRLVGRYWRPAHVKGSAAAGTVHKTYTITSTPGERATV